ncbi:MAG: MarR family winged helix-turn-helix transcriptional regulator [Acidiferrobacterales bacterium]
MPRAKRVAKSRHAGGTTANNGAEAAREALKKFRIIFSSVRKHFEDVQSRCGVSGAQLWVVFEIFRNPGVRVSELAQALSIHQSTASNLVAGIEKKGLLLKERGGPDQRVVRLHLTRKGKEVVAKAPKPVMGVLPDALHQLPNKALRDLNTNLDALISLMHLTDETAATKPLSDL